MKRNLMIISLIFFSMTAYSQENRFTLSGGYASATVEDINTAATGFRINALYEINPNEGKVSHGFSIGYIGTSTTYSIVGQSNEYKINSWPIYYAPKYLIGNGSAQGFIKGALGMQFSGLTRKGSLAELSSNDFGFYGGAGAGFTKTFNEKIFINLEYEWAYLSNSYYRDGFMNSFMLGVGVKF